MWLVRRETALHGWGCPSVILLIKPAVENIISQGHFLQKVALRGFIAVCREDFNYHILGGVIISAAGSVKNPL